ncbi:hypothetical protein L195_g015837 [Trifolium pratense]|uniref:Uncharacterized protein n=1 Tax=Trifolium pratense TaxID=57577 RepID=A0A2K3MPI3_TRIPR|nr:hypothetical protein L195_g015837 [Trifolium pratense]
MRASWLAFSVLHLLFISFYFWLHTEPDILKQSHYVLDMLFVMSELLCFSFYLIADMPRPDEKLALDYAYTVIANGLMSITLAAYFDCPFILNGAEFIWLPLAGYMIGCIKNDIRRHFISKFIQTLNSSSSHSDPSSSSSN